ncbi:hypothetical protein XENTR_v10017489 [Xenopus tropicalis]|uniref:Ig-like domain-containing protein n=1 Tax=Xenopus tropicalis TaxID=8364 RepID=A0A803K944_XENTR|nr:hypothetical protein XENTR_v10017489 [Xenopus tropicalis]
MGGLLTVLLLMNLLIGPLYGVKVTQDKKLLIIGSGEDAELSCRHDDSSYYNMYWYQEKPGLGLKLMLFSLNAGSETLESDYRADWEAERKVVLNSTLRLKKGNVGDSATYFCAASIHGNARLPAPWHQTPPWHQTQRPPALGWDPHGNGLSYGERLAQLGLVTLGGGGS